MLTAIITIVSGLIVFIVAQIIVINIKHAKTKGQAINVSLYSLFILIILIFYSTLIYFSYTVLKSNNPINAKEIFILIITVTLPLYLGLIFILQKSIGFMQDIKKLL